MARIVDNPRMESTAPHAPWDIFCQVIDNHGDLGVCWRLACDLATRGQPVRLWVDDASALRWMAPHDHPGVTVLPWTTPLHPEMLSAHPPGAVLVEAFGCEVAPEFVAAYAIAARARGHFSSENSAWINLEYLSAEPYVARCHALPSPCLSGPGQGLTKHFYYPGFTPDTGGLLREPDLAARQAHFERCAWLRAQPWGQGIDPARERLVSLFCYEPPALGEWLTQLAQGAQPTRLLVTAGRASAAVQAEIEQQNSRQPSWNGRGLLSISYLPHLSQIDYDHLLWSCDLNFVRGEDSLVRALWAGVPLVWHIYPQDDLAHHAKLEAFLDWLQAPASLRAFHRIWNGLQHAALPAPELSDWRRCTEAARQGLLAQSDLTQGLLTFVQHLRATPLSRGKTR